MTPRRRRVVAGLGLLVPGAALTVASAFVVISGGNCSAITSHVVAGGGCASDAAGAAVVTFPAALVCLLLCAAVLRGSRWARWPAVLIGGVLGTATAAGGLAGVVALGRDDAGAAIAVGLVGLVIACSCALPALLLGGNDGAVAFGGESDEPDEPDEPEAAER